MRSNERASECRLPGRPVAQRRKMSMREGSSASVPRTRSKAAKERREAEKVESIQWLDKLPHELWAKVLDNVDENDLFSLALSCRYFRQKQKELVARTTRPSGRESGVSRLALKTTVLHRLVYVQPASADYLQFCSKEEVSRDVGQKRDKCIRSLAALHGYLPLLQELLKASETFEGENFSEIATSAGEFSSSSLSLLLRLGF